MREAQTMRLMSEPCMSLDLAEQEEQRRVFWSVFLLDRLISCAKGRPLAIQDDECTLQLPCDEETLRAGQWKATYTLRELLSWDVPGGVEPSSFGLVILTAAVFGRCTKYVYSERHEERIPPWHTDSEMSRLGSSLLLLESFISADQQNGMGARTSPEESQVLFARILFHLCHCLLNHPAVIRSRLGAFASRVPAGFTHKAMQAAHKHAVQLTDLVGGEDSGGCLFESSFYPYCIVVAGGIHAMAAHWPDVECETTAPDAAEYANKSLRMLEQLAATWQHATSMALRLGEFICEAELYAAILDPATLTDGMGLGEHDRLWTMIDYGMVCTSSPPQLELPGSDPLLAPLWGPVVPVPGQFETQTVSPFLHLNAC
jgi:hypothetical protein